MNNQLKKFAYDLAGKDYSLSRAQDDLKYYIEEYENAS